ncbi:hypothetical protein [Escherichia coli]|uniref:hypothetical protein n=1 Tax=Escherichia coli TaxID=562 RepID=UPI003975EC95
MRPPVPGWRSDRSAAGAAESRSFDCFVYALAALHIRWQLDLSALLAEPQGEGAATGPCLIRGMSGKSCRCPCTYRDLMTNELVTVQDGRRSGYFRV